MKSGDCVKKKMLLIVNPRSGRNRLRGDLLDITNVFSFSGYSINIMNTAGPGDATKFVLEHGSEYDTVVCRGGDGTLCETLNGLMQLEKKPALGLIPAGTTNDVAHSLGIPTDPIKAARLIVDGEARPCDIARFNEKYFVYVGSFGAFASTSYTAKQSVKNRIGKFAYYLEAFGAIKDIREIPMRFTVDGEVIEDSFVFGSVSNSYTVGGGVITLDKSQVCLNDGKYELFLAKNPRTVKNWVSVCAGVLKKDFDERFIKVYHGSHIELEALDGSPLPWTLDGEYGGDDGKVTIDIQNGAFKLFRPAMPNEPENIDNVTQAKQ